jgi:hypothetical protein
VKFSPDDRRLAICGFTLDRIVLIDVAIEASAGGTQVALTRCTEITSPSLREPHGLCFLDDETLVVANRSRRAVILRLPAPGDGNETLEVPALRTLWRANLVRPLHSPGSACASRLPDGRLEVLICNNYANRVTRHVLDTERDFRVTRNEVLLHRGLDVPDGVAIDRQRRWIAVSNHNTHSILVYENTPQLGRRSRPDGILHDVGYPHGVLFTPDADFVIAADAGAPMIRIYADNGGDWRGERHPIRSVRVMDDATFHRGRQNPEEGGPKGIDVDGRMRVLATTCEHQVLAFFDVARMLGG